MYDRYSIGIVIDRYIIFADRENVLSIGIVIGIVIGIGIGIVIGIGAELGGAAGARAPPVLQSLKFHSIKWGENSPKFPASAL